MLKVEVSSDYPSEQILLANCVASRIKKKDASLYSFSEEAQSCAEKFMGWVDLASNPPYPLEDLFSFAKKTRDAGMESVLMIGQGGSVQAPMAITKYHKPDSMKVSFKVIDSDSAVRMRSALENIDPKTTLVVLASKSGSTIEPNLAFSVVREEFKKTIDEQDLKKHFVAITDPGSNVEKMAREEGWAGIFPGEVSVGGRFSALSVFGLFAAALVGIDMDAFMDFGKEAEEACSQDNPDNPALHLAAFLYDNYISGRNKFSFLTQKRGRVLGLWIEQLVAESLGKLGQGILPQIEVDPLLLVPDHGDRCAVVYHTKNNSWDERENFAVSLSCINENIPQAVFTVGSAEELAGHFVLWEYAVSMCAYLMKVCPFDQPDVASAKQEVNTILNEGFPPPHRIERFVAGFDMGEAELRTSPHFESAETIQEALRQLFASIGPGDYFAFNAFLPFMGEGRREALNAVRHSVALKRKVVSCLEIGPRYLHSTGQLQKGGPNCGVFLIVSADEIRDIPLKERAESMGELAHAQAVGDFVALSEKGRRCVHVHLPNNSAVALRTLAALVDVCLE